MYSTPPRPPSWDLTSPMKTFKGIILPHADQAQKNSQRDVQTVIDQNRKTREKTLAGGYIHHRRPRRAIQMASSQSRLIPTVRKSRSSGEVRVTMKRQTDRTQCCKPTGLRWESNIGKCLRLLDPLGLKPPLSKEDSRRVTSAP